MTSKKPWQKRPGAFDDCFGLSFQQALRADGTTNNRHIPLTAIEGSSIGDNNKLGYTIQTQPAMDGNSVDLDRERANFVDNSVRYEATLRFINGSSRTILSAIQGQ